MELEYTDFNPRSAIPNSATVASILISLCQVPHLSEWNNITLSGLEGN